MFEKSIILRKIEHRNAWRIGLFFDKDSALILKCKSIGARFSATKKCWYVDYSKENYEILKKTFEKLVVELPKNRSEAILPKTSKPLPIPSPNSNSEKEGISSEPNPESNWPDKLKFTLLKNMGKYWVFQLQYHYLVTPKLKQINGVFWNQAYKSFFAIRNHTIKVKIEEILEAPNLLPTDFFNPKTTFSGEKIYIAPHEADPQWMAVMVPNIAEIQDELKRISFYRYHKETQCYLYPAAPSLLKLLGTHLSSFGVKIVSTLPPGYLNERHLPNRKKQQLMQTKERLIDHLPIDSKAVVNIYVNHLLAKNYSASTLDSYTQAFIRFLRHHPNQHPETMAPTQIMEYLAGLMLNGLSASAGNTTVNALKMYYYQILGKTNYDLNIPRPKREKKLPVFLSEEEVKRLFMAVENKKHKLLLLIAYGAGLRVGELVTLKWEDIRWDQQKIHIKGGKGKKDRVVMLPHAILTILKNYRLEYQPKVYVFEGQFAGMAYSTRSVQEIMRTAREKSGLELKATPHALRHSFATHLIEKGTDIRYIQQLLGHKEIKTTMIYTHVTDSAINKIASPLDHLVSDHQKQKK